MAEGKTRNEKFMSQLTGLEDKALNLEKKLSMIKLNQMETEKTLPIILFLQGIIGVGKTTVGLALAERIKDAVFIPEPLDVSNHLKHYYKCFKCFKI